MGMQKPKQTCRRPTFSSPHQVDGYKAHFFRVFFAFQAVFSSLHSCPTKPPEIARRDRAQSVRGLGDIGRAGSRLKPQRLGGRLDKDQLVVNLTGAAILNFTCDAQSLVEDG